MEKSTISEIPYSFTCTVYDFLLLAMLEADMVVYRESEHHLHGSNQKISPVFLNYCEEVESVYVSHTDCSYDSSKPDEYDDYEFTSKIPESYIFLESIYEYLVKIWTRCEKYDVYE